MSIVASAPGKLFLLGEYAVLEGAPALLTAVDRRAIVKLTPATHGNWSLTAPQLELDKLALAADGGLPPDLPAAIATPLNIYAATRQQASGTLKPMDIHIDSADFYQHGCKLGLGSSAAVTAALSCAFGQAAGEELSTTALCQRAMTAHRAAQGGIGSGADIAASCHGGSIVFSRGHPPRPLAWPADLHALTIITGQGADTPILVGKVNALRQHSRAAYRKHMHTLQTLAANGCQAMADGDTASLLRVLDDYYTALATLGQAANAGIVTSAHRQLHAAVADAGGVFKTTGAGGGDIGLAFYDDTTTPSVVQQAVTALGFEILPLSFCAKGARRVHSGPKKNRPRARGSWS